MASQAERLMRDAGANRLRALFPEARIIHELVMGECRADLAAVTPDQIIAVEIKSARDKLDRLKDQVRTFRGRSHVTVVLADCRWTWSDIYDAGATDVEIWRGMTMDDAVVPAEGEWAIPAYRFRRAEPHAAKLLDLLWADELRAEARRASLQPSPRTPRWECIRPMCELMTGREIRQAVCRQLRMRPFPEADAPCPA